MTQVPVPPQINTRHLGEPSAKLKTPKPYQATCPLHEWASGRGGHVDKDMSSSPQPWSVARGDVEDLLRI